MKILILILSLLLPGLSLFAQSYTISGKVLDGQTNKPMQGVAIGFNSKFSTSTNKKGEFTLAVKEDCIKDTLVIQYFQYYDLKITDLPRDKGIDLGTIPLFEYNFPHPIVSFHCGTFDFLCKLKEKRFWRNYKKSRKDYFDRVNSLIESHKLSYNGKTFPIDLDTHLLLV